MGFNFVDFVTVSDNHIILGDLVDLFKIPFCNGDHDHFFNYREKKKKFRLIPIDVTLYIRLCISNLIDTSMKVSIDYNHLSLKLRRII